MDAESERKPLLAGGSALLIEDFCRHTGLDQDTVANLLRTGRLEGAIWVDEERTRPFGIFDDELPSRQALEDMGLPVRDDYKADELRSFDMPDDDPDAE